MMKPPSFWYQRTTLAERILTVALAPLGLIYGFLVRKKFDLYFPVPMSKPIICVGNLVAGGAGKTPVVLSLVDLLKNKGYNPHLLTRGYGGVETGPLQISPERDTAYDVGDEALLLVDKAPTWVSSNRALGAQTAMDTGANIVVMDDGFQNPIIYKDFSILAVDGGVGFGNAQVMPAGPLRESIAFGLSRADAVVMIGDDKTNATELIKKHTHKPILSAKLVADANNPMVKDQKIFAFAGIGRPQKFKDTLISNGAIMEGWAEFPDHFAYTEEDLKEIVSAAEKAGAPLITTTKDHVRLPPALKSKIQKFSVHPVWDSAQDIIALIEHTLQRRAT